MSNSKSNPKIQDPDWDSAPKPLEADITAMDPGDRMAHLKIHIDEGKARKLVQLMDGSADDYDRNMVRIEMWLTGIQHAIGTAIKIIAIA